MTARAHISESFGHCTLEPHSNRFTHMKRASRKSHVLTQAQDTLKLQMTYDLAHFFIGNPPTNVRPVPKKTRRTCMFFGWEPQRNAKIHNLRGAVEGGDGVAIVLGVLQKLEEVVSGDNSGRDVAGSNHGCSCWIRLREQLVEEELWQIFFLLGSSKSKSAKARRGGADTFVIQNWEIGSTLISRYPPGPLLRWAGRPGRGRVGGGSRSQAAATVL